MEAYNSDSGRPGKTPPRFIADLLEYDPTNPERNVLCDAPPYVDESTAAKLLLQRHRHSLSLRRSRSALPPPRASDTSAPWTVSSICEICRAHIDVIVDSSQPTLSESGPCPTKDNPLHHLRYEPSRSWPAARESFGKTRFEDIRVFSCSATTCPTTVTVITKPPILDLQSINLLTDKSVLKRRIQKYEEAQGVKSNQDASPVKVLETFQKYLSNVIGGDKRKIPRENARYQLHLSDECAPILKTLGFKDFQDGDALSWAPPTLEEIDNKDGPVRRNLEDTVEEVLILMDQHRERRETYRAGIERADTMIRQLLRGNYDSYGASHSIDLTKPEHPFYAVLGIVSDVADKIVAWAYRRQRDCNPSEAAFYFECFSVIARGRSSDDLLLDAAKLQSQGEFTRTEHTEACSSLGIDPKEQNEDLIIGIFRARLADAPRQESQIRNAMRIMARQRRSSRLEFAAQKAFTDLKGAYAWLDVPENIDDQFLIVTYDLRVSDHPVDEPIAKEALKAIAEARRSTFLLSYIEKGGAIYDMPPNINEAYTRLGIEDPSVVDDDLLISLFNLRWDDEPSKIQDLRGALRVIGENRDSHKIKDFLDTGNANDHTRGSTSSPVGLENIGNTCYLNSLLQFYFTIKPLREMILQLDQYQEGEVTDEVVSRKRVGGRKVTKQEIERAKKFVGHLRTLFAELIKSTSSAISPERDLAYLALVSSKDEAESEESAVTIAVTNADDTTASTNVDDMDVDQAQPGAPVQDDDARSEVTLVNDSQDVVSSEDQMVVNQVQKEEKENMPPQNEDAPMELIDLSEPPSDEGMELTAGVQTLPTPPPEPERMPPPIPMRPRARRDTVSDINMFGRQQDVTECIGNVMFQIEAAIKPDRIDENGEQIDLVKEYFYGKTKQTLAFPNSMETRTKEEMFSHLLVNVSEGDCDLYTALDNSFDIERVDLEGREATRHLSISHLPPVLQIQVQRVQFDREKGAAYKSNAHLSFPETLFMDRYLDNDDAGLMARREETWNWKQTLKELVERKAELLQTTLANENSLSVLDAAREWVEGMQANLDTDLIEEMDIQPNVVEMLERRTAAVRREVESIDQNIKELESRINQQFTDLRKHGYRIHSVFIHRGSVSFGHYWIYIYDFQKRLFRKYNDQYVTEVLDEAEVFKHSVEPGSSPPTPYFLVFVRETELDITEAVKRTMEG